MRCGWVGGEEMLVAVFDTRFTAKCGRTIAGQVHLMFQLVRAWKSERRFGVMSCGQLVDFGWLWPDLMSVMLLVVEGCAICGY